MIKFINEHDGTISTRLIEFDKNDRITDQNGGRPIEYVKPFSKVHTHTHTILFESVR